MVALVHQPFSLQCIMFYDGWAHRLVNGCLRPLFNCGHIGVDIFFVISGFIITWVSWNSFGNWRNIYSFVVKRIVRIYPVYWVALLMAIAGLLIFPSAYKMVRLTSDLACNIFIMPCKSSNGFLLNVVWSLVYELLFYALFAALLPFSRRVLVWVLGVWAILILGMQLPAASWLRLQLAVPNQAWHYVQLWLAVFLSPLNLYFILGSVVAFGVKANKIPPGSRYILMLASLLLLPLTLLFNHLNGGISSYSPGLKVALLAVPCCLLVWSVIGAEWESGTSMSPRWLQLVGNASYSLYLVHTHVFRLLEKLWVNASLDDMPWLLLITFVLSVVLSVGLALLMYRYIEAPAMEWGKVWLDRPRPK